jgi:hypothetical protein
MFAKKKNILSKQNQILFEVLLLLLYFLLAGLFLDLTKPILVTVINGTELNTGDVIKYITHNIIIFSTSVCCLIVFQYKFISYIIVGGLFALVGFLNSVFITLSIITVVWHCGIGAFLVMSLMLCYVYNDLKKDLTKIKNIEHSKMISLKTDIWEILKIVIQITLYFCVITGVCMTILFNKGDETVDKKLDAIQMVVGFIFCGFSVYIWGFHRGYNILGAIRNREVHSTRDT